MADGGPVRGPKKKSELRKEQEKALKDRLIPQGVGYLTPVPYGNSEVSFDKKTVIGFWQKKIQSSEWPKWLMSYETWCAMTCYNPEAENGGKAFQKLMLQLLGAPGKSKIEPRGAQTRNLGTDDNRWYDTLDFDHFWHPDKKGDKRYGPMFKTKFNGDEIYTTIKANGAIAGANTDPAEEDLSKLNVAELRARLQALSLSDKGKKADLLKRLQEEQEDEDEVDDGGGSGFKNSGGHLGYQSRPLMVPLKSTNPANGDKDYDAVYNKRKPAGKTVTAGVYPGYATPMGLQLGNFSGSSKAFAQTNYATSANHYTVFSKHDWLVKANLQTGTKGSQAQGKNSSQSTGQAYVTEGHDKLNAGAQCWETTNPFGENAEPCVPVANTLAAIYGLYFYPNCKSFDLDPVFETVGDTTFRIRMRCPNPQYGKPNWTTETKNPMENDKLYIYEELNKLNATYLDGFWKGLFDNNKIKGEDQKWDGRTTHTHVGGPDASFKKGQRIEVPHMTRHSKLAGGQLGLSPWAHLHNSEGLMQVAPFWRHENKHHKPSNQDHFDRGQMMRAKGIVVCSDEKSGGPSEITFGFRMAAAMLLFPHNSNKWTHNMQTGPPDAIKLEANNFERAYMQEPRWSATNVNLLTAVKTDPENSLAYKYLNWQEWSNLSEPEWRAKLLNVGGVQQPAAPLPPPEPAETTPVAAGQNPFANFAQAVTSDDQTPIDDQDLGGLPVGENFGPVEPDEAAGTGADPDEQESVEMGRKQNRNKVEVTFGVPGMGLAETLANCNETVSFSYNGKAHNFNMSTRDIQEETIQKVMTMKERDLMQPTGPPNRLKVLEAYQALKKCGLYEEGLAEGAPKRGSEAQCHWRSSSHQPWSYSQCYVTPKLIFEYEVQDEEAIETYRLKYGNDANLYLNNQTNPSRISKVSTQWGAPKPAMDMVITSPGKDFRLNLVKILCIYYDNAGVGPYSGNEKRKGMLNGLHRHKTGPGGDKQDTIPKNTRSTNGEAQKGYIDVFKPVFLGAPTFGRQQRKFLECVSDYICKRDVTDDNVLEECMKHGFGDNWHTHEAWENIKSDMTVSQWVCTPWHYEHLPYERQYAIFRDGECYSEGCRRCCRPFYEYAYHVYADGRSSKPKTYGYPSQLWYKTSDKNASPIPLHDPYFWAPQRPGNEDPKWSDAVPEAKDDNMFEGGLVAPTTDSATVKRREKALTSKRQQGKRTELETLAAADRASVPDIYDEETGKYLGTDVPREFEEYVGGTMAWPTFRLLTDKLWRTDAQRVGVLDNKAAGMHFRRYYNLAYSDEPAGGLNNENGYYKSISQGVMNQRQKASYGVLGYRLQRSHKYGNVCRDCASLLDRAPGLFVRNNRWTFDGGLVPGNLPTVRDASYTYWTAMLGQQGGLVTDGKGGYKRMAISLDDLLMQQTTQNGIVHKFKKKEITEKPNGAAEWDQIMQKFEIAGRRFAEVVDHKHKFPNNFTLIETPTINTQFRERQDIQLTESMVQDAVRQLNTALQTNSAAAINMNNEAIRHMVREIERKYVRNDTYQRIDYTKQFDSDIQRYEYRNCEISWTPGGLIWRNSPLNGANGPISQKLPSFSMTTDAQGQPVHIPRKFGNLTSTRYPLNKADGRTYKNCLVTVQYDPQAQGYDRLRPQTIDYRVDVYLVTLTDSIGNKKQSPSNTQWHGDRFVAEWNGQQWVSKDVNFASSGVALTQMRTLRQSRLFITYSLHRPITSEKQGRHILEKMADALHELFGNDKWLSQMIVFGRKLKDFDAGVQQDRSLGDNISRTQWGIIDKTRKQDAMSSFYGSRSDKDVQTSYIHDTYETHIDSVEVDGGCEIGPKMGHPHFHLLLTLNHFSYVQFDYYKMNTFLELMFKGVQTAHDFGGDTTGKKFMLGSEDEPFYGDNENPYVDIRLYPQDNWKEVLAAYVRKASGSADMFSVLAGRALPKTAEERRKDHMANVQRQHQNNMANAV